MAIQKRIKREQKIFLYPVKENTFEINSEDKQVLVNAEEDYFIYFKNVFFREFGVIEGRYLGENPHAMIDKQCREVSYSFEKSNWIAHNGKVFKGARLVAVNNKTGVIVVIQK